MKEAIEEPGFMSRIKCDSACTDESILCLALLAAHLVIVDD